MPNYRRRRIEGAMYFFTLVTHMRRRILGSEKARTLLRRAFDDVRRRRPFELVGVALLPEHLHILMRLPDGDSNYSQRIGGIKRNFTAAHLAGGGREAPQTPSRRRQRYRGIWQKRFYEHCIRDYDDFRRHLDYIHANPVKHGLVARPWDWQWSSFRRYVGLAWYDEDWSGGSAPGSLDCAPEFW